ncbi:MAG: asparagine synthase-related protein [Thermodesulfobacteriota bacterium]|nr:asparagine synthase-related protein [Thermodesulfobacteriota bacterium]
MSGIVFLAQQESLINSRELLKKMTDYLTYRGPDRQKIWYENNAHFFVGMGQAQLFSTFNSFNEKCPLSYKNTFHIVSDSRIDAKDTLIRKLKHDFSCVDSNTPDSELILYSYIKWQEKCVNNIIGDFAFFIWDCKSNLLFAARNHTGSIPLYYSHLRDGLILSNTLNCIKKHPKISLRLNHQAIGDFLLFRQNWDVNTTIYTDIQKIPPGSYLIWQNNRIKIENYWQPPQADIENHYKNSKDSIEEFEDVFFKAVSERIDSPNIDIMLSGGMDSSSVAAFCKKYILEQNLPINVKAFTVTHNSLFDDEEEYYTRRICKKLSIPITYIEGEKYLKKDYSKEFIYPEPSLWCHQSSWNAFIGYIESAPKPPVILTGFGADPFFMKGNNYWTNMLREGKFSFFLRDTFCHMRLTKKIPLYISRGHLRNFFHEKRSFLPEWFNSDFVNKYALENRYDTICARNRNSTGRIIIEFWSYLQTAGDSDQLMLPVKFLYPFLDIRVIDFFSRIPVYPLCHEKLILRKVMKRHLPIEVINRPKTVTPNHPVFMHVKKRKDWQWLLDILKKDNDNRYISNDPIMNRIKENKMTDNEIHFIMRVVALKNWSMNCNNE